MPASKFAVVAISCLFCVFAFAVKSHADFPGRSWEPDQPSGTKAAESGRVKVEPSTLHSIGVRWPIRGDDNGNARVAVHYRMQGQENWTEALPLFWIHPQRQPKAHRVDRGRLFAGSIVGLDPATDYEIRLTLTDSDGGGQTNKLDVSTRPVPGSPASMRTRHVAPVTDGGPGDGTGAPDAPLRGLARALRTAESGDLFLLQPGRYRAANLDLNASGTPENPIVIRGASGGPVVLDGNGADVAMDVSDQRHVWIEGVAFENARVLLRAERSPGLVVRRNSFQIPLRRNASGVETLDADSTGYIITDNEFAGPNSSWPMETRRKTIKELINGITIAGSGHDIAYNRIRGVGDGVNTGRMIDHNPLHKGLSASDIYNNDIDLARNECIEADHALSNVRVYNNRLTNCLYGVSTQPSRGGPVYIFRNRLLNMNSGPFKLHNHTSGVLLFHNTSVIQGFPLLIQPGRETVNDVITRNNIFIGTRTPALQSTGQMKRTDFDNDGYAYGLSGTFLRWNRRTFEAPREAAEAGVAYKHHGAHMLFAGQTFQDGPRPPRGEPRPLSPSQNVPRLAERSRALDQAVRLPNFNDDFEGDGPDLGCCERGQELPYVGPRKSF